jgi:hypothetical protein
VGKAGREDAEFVRLYAERLGVLHELDHGFPAEDQHRGIEISRRVNPAGIQNSHTAVFSV